MEQQYKLLTKQSLKELWKVNLKVNIDSENGSTDYLDQLSGVGLTKPISSISLFPYLFQNH